MTADDEYLSLKMAVAEYPALGGMRYWRGLVEQRKIPYYKPTAGRIVLRRSDIEALISSGKHDAIGSTP